MNSLIKEIVLDVFQLTAPIETRLDIEEGLYQYAVTISERNAEILIKYAHGYTNSELAVRYGTTVTDIDLILTSVLSFLAEYTNNQDEVLLQHIYTTERLPYHKVIEAKSFLEQHGNDFSTHSPIKELVHE